MTAPGVIHVCRFDSTEELRTTRVTYANIKALVLKAGRFSVFEATSTPKRAQIFTDLCRDPELETFDLPFPWTGVRLRDRGMSFADIEGQLASSPERERAQDTPLDALLAKWRGEGKRLESRALSDRSLDVRLKALDSAEILGRFADELAEALAASRR